MVSGGPQPNSKYVAIIPDDTGAYSSGWKAQLHEPLEDRHGLLGSSPEVQIGDGHSDLEKRRKGRGLGPRKIFPRQVTLTAAESDKGFRHGARFYLDKRLVRAFQPRDILNIFLQTAAASLIRDGELVIGLGSVRQVPLGNGIEVRVAEELDAELEALFQKYDPGEIPIQRYKVEKGGNIRPNQSDLEEVLSQSGDQGCLGFSTSPLEVRVGEMRRILTDGGDWRGPMGEYEVTVRRGPEKRGFLDIYLSEDVLIYRRGICSVAGALASSDLFTNPEIY